LLHLRAMQAATVQQKPLQQASPTGSTAPLAIEASGLLRRFGPVTALDHISLSIRKGEFFSLLGPSGCGKTTLLRAIAGLDSPDAGSLRIGGVDAAQIPAHRRPVNTVFQSYALFPHMTVRDNVAFGLRMKRVPPLQTGQRVERVLSLTQITELADRGPAQLSGGQKQRVALARALVNEPDVLLLDEPLGALDLKLRKQLQMELHQLQRRLGITFLYVTHDQEEALVISDRIAVMNAGRIEQVDEARALYERPQTRFVAQFLGSCNLLSATVQNLSGDLVAANAEFGRIQVKLDARCPTLSTGKQVTLAIRPEKVTLGKTSEASGTNWFDARIADLVYSGAETQYRLAIGDHTLNAVVLNSRSGHQSLHVGAIVSCHLPAASLIVLDD